MDGAQIVMWGNLVIFNGAIILLLKYTLKDIVFTDVMREKSLPMPSPIAPPPGPPPAPGPAPAPGQPAAGPNAGGDTTSYSRVTGIMGAIVLVAFLWAIGNIILYNLVVAPEKVKDIMTNVGSYFWIGAALFMPYAANQLTAIFKR